MAATGLYLSRISRLLALQRKQRHDEWPYVWLFAPPDAKDVFVEKTIAAPANNTLTEVLVYQVPAGSNFVLTQIVQAFSGTGYTPGGPALWTIDVNKPVGLASTNGRNVEGFASVDVQLGSTTNLPWPLARARMFKANDTLRSKVITTAAISAGGSNFFTSIFIGYTWPSYGPGDEGRN